jgi:hypothetical protein
MLCYRHWAADFIIVAQPWFPHLAAECPAGRNGKMFTRRPGPLAKSQHDGEIGDILEDAVDGVGLHDAAAESAIGRRRLLLGSKSFPRLPPVAVGTTPEANAV